jgi:hypothetical protein
MRADAYLIVAAVRLLCAPTLDEPAEIAARDSRRQFASGRGQYLRMTRQTR